MNQEGMWFNRKMWHHEQEKQHKHLKAFKNNF